MLSWDARECSLTDKEVVERQGTKVGQFSKQRDVSGGFPQVAKPSMSRPELAKGTNSEVTKFSQDTKFFKVKLFFQ